MNDVVETNSTNAFIAMIEKIVSDPNVDVEKFSKILDLQERILDKQAEAAYTRDFALMQAELPSVMKRGKSNNNTYATFDDIMDAVREPAARFGFAISFEPDTQDNLMHVKATISHREGHKQVSMITLPFDNSGSKNAVQAIGSAQKYGMRYAIVAILAISTHDGSDDDAASQYAKLDDVLANELQEAAAGYGLESAKILAYYSKKLKRPINNWTDIPEAAYAAVLKEIRRSGKAKTA